MGLKSRVVGLKDFAQENSLRNDFDFLDFQQDLRSDDNYTFSDLFDLPLSHKVDTDILLDDFYYAEISNVTKEGDISPTKLNFVERNPLEENYYKKIEAGNILRASSGDILISKVRPNLKKYALVNDKTKDIYFTTAFARITPKTMGKTLYYSLRSIFFRNLIAISRQGKGYPTINEKDFSYLRFEKAVVDTLISNQAEIDDFIKPIEANIWELQTKIKSQVDIINNVFAREFNLDIKHFEELKTIKSYKLSLQDAGSNVDLRNSFPFHHQSVQYVMNELCSISKTKIKHFLAEPIVLGASIKPADFDENGEVYYISMASVKNYVLELDETQRVSKSYASMNANKRIELNDIIMTRSGAAIGKFALVESETEGIFADFTMRIRLKNYNPLFAYYYFRSAYFQHLIHSNKKGLQNKNIFPGQIQEFPLIDIELNRQEEIVAEIKAELIEQDKLLKQIAEERERISLYLSKLVEV